MLGAVSVSNATRLLPAASPVKKAEPSDLKALVEKVDCFIFDCDGKFGLHEVTSACCCVACQAAVTVGPPTACMQVSSGEATRSSRAYPRRSTSCDRW